MSNFIVLKNIGKSYHESCHSVLNNFDLALNLGSSISVQGKSGCGKSTLLYILGLLDKPTRGDYFLDNINVINLTPGQKAKIRNQYFGFVFQNHQLIPYLSVLENIYLPYQYRKEKMNLSWREYLLLTLEIQELISRFPHELSLGQQQRVAIARALITQPKVILADEPTASLDSELADIYMSLLLNYVRDKKALYIMVTHDKNLAIKTDQQLYL